MKRRTQEELEIDLKSKSKVCGACRERKPLRDFHKSARSLDGCSHRCKECDRLARQRWQRANPERAQASQRRRNIQHKYGLSESDYQDLLVKQDHKCAICGVGSNGSAFGKNVTPSFAVDHCHTTGRVRGLLCNQCNRALGMFKDDPVLVSEALKYLETH